MASAFMGEDGWHLSFGVNSCEVKKKVSGIHPSAQPSLHMSVPCLPPLSSIMFNSSVMFGYTHYSDV